MADFFFFTDLDATSVQTKSQAFGPVDNLNYNVENKFLVTKDAPAIAVLEGIPFVQQCADKEDCVNIVLLPLSNPDFDFPNIKFFVYRGIKKSSLFKENGNLQDVSTASSWKSDNIIKKLHELQDKINQENEVTGDSAPLPRWENLGYHYSIDDGDKYIADTGFVERTIFLEDTIQLPLVKAGSQIGQFVGDKEAAGFQIIQDRLGYEPTLGDIRKAESKIEITALLGTLKSEIFEHWHQKEAVLTYVDPAALYGCAKANGEKVKAYTGTTSKKEDAETLVNLFYNKEVVYLDIRNDQNYSYDYYDNFGKTIRLSFERAGFEELVPDFYEYYEDWPLFRIIEQEVLPDTNNPKFDLDLPFKGIAEINARFFLKSYTHDFLPEGKQKTNFTEINNKYDSNSFSVRYSPNITLKSWKSSSSKLGANYFLFKYALKSNNYFADDNSGRNPLFSTHYLGGTFPITMKALIGDDDDDIEDGDFRVYTYSSINAPLMVKNEDFGDTTHEMYSQRIGIAIEKEHVTFFSFSDEVGYSSSDRKNYPLSLIQKGKYENSVYLDEFEYDQASQSLGFLTMLPFRVANGNLKLLKVKDQISYRNGLSITDEERDFLYLINTRPLDENYFFIDPNRFDAITITKAEYRELLKSNKQSISSFRHYLDMTTDNYLNPNADGKILISSKLGLKGIVISDNQPEGEQINHSRLVSENLTSEDLSEDQFVLNGLILKN